MQRRKRYQTEIRPPEPIDLGLKLEEIIAQLDGGVAEWLIHTDDSRERK